MAQYKNIHHAIRDAMKSNKVLAEDFPPAGGGDPAADPNAPPAPTKTAKDTRAKKVDTGDEPIKKDSKTEIILEPTTDDSEISDGITKTTPKKKLAVESFMSDKARKARESRTAEDHMRLAVEGQHKATKHRIELARAKTPAQRKYHETQADSHDRAVAHHIYHFLKKDETRSGAKKLQHSLHKAGHATIKPKSKWRFWEEEGFMDMDREQLLEVSSQRLKAYSKAAGDQESTAHSMSKKMDHSSPIKAKLDKLIRKRQNGQNRAFFKQAGAAGTKVPASGRDDPGHKPSSYARRHRNESIEHLDEEHAKRVEINHAEYKKIEAQHKAAKGNPRLGYAHEPHLYKKDGGSVQQYNSHPNHKIPSIEAHENGKHYKFVKESLDEGKMSPEFRKQVQDTNTYLDRRHDDIVARHKKGHSNEKIAKDMGLHVAVVSASTGILHKEDVEQVNEADITNHNNIKVGTITKNGNSYIGTHTSGKTFKGSSQSEVQGMVRMYHSVNNGPGVRKSVKESTDEQRSPAVTTKKPKTLPRDLTPFMKKASSVKTGKEKIKPAMKEEEEMSNLQKIKSILEARHSAGGGKKRQGLESDSDDHIINQLRKSTNLRDHQVTFKDKSKHHVPAHIAKTALYKYSGLRTSQEKDALSKAFHASHESFKNALAGKMPAKKSHKITLPTKPFDWRK
jgi:hypothetical protein